jgi:hypothetical protein
VPHIFLQVPSSGLMTHLAGSFQNLKTKAEMPSKLLHFMYYLITDTVQNKETVLENKCV